jgi:monoamine oxidase
MSLKRNSDQTSLLPAEPGPTLPQPCNPTTQERHALLKYALREANRLEDFCNIVKTLSPPPNITDIAPPGQFKGVKVGIIGGGLAGLSSAFELRKLGFDITVFDALEDRIGGRVYTYYFNKEKTLYGELGPMRIPVAHETIWHYINLFGLDTRPFIQSNENAFIYVRDIRVRNDPEGKNVMEKIYPQFNLRPWERNTPWTELLSYGLGTPISMMHPAVRKEILQTKPFYHPQLLYWTGLSIRKVMETMGLSQGAINLIASLSPLSGAFYYNSYYEILQEDYPVDFSFLYEIVGGLAKLPYAFYSSLMSETPKEYGSIPIDSLGRVTWKGGTIVTGIHQDNDKDKVILKYENKYLDEPLYESFDYIVCAIPYSTLRNVTLDPLFSPRKMQAIREVNYATSQKTLFLCSKRFWEEGGPNERIVGGGSYTDLSISSIWYPSDHGKCNIKHSDRYKRGFSESPINSWDLRSDCSPNDPGVLLASYNFSQDSIRLGNLPPQRRFEEMKRQDEAVHGLPKGYLNTIAKSHKTVHWNTQKNFRGAFCYFMPEQKRLFSYVMILPEYNNRVFFAGEHTSPTHAWQQGALNSGMRAANQLAFWCRTKASNDAFVSS